MQAEEAQEWPATHNTAAAGLGLSPGKVASPHKQGAGSSGNSGTDDKAGAHPEL
jgi:hypothetical protein